MVAVPILGPAQPGPAPCPLLLGPGRNSQERTPQVQPSSSQGSELWVSTESLQKLWEELMDPEAQTTPAWQPLCLEENLSRHSQPGDQHRVGPFSLIPLEFKLPST